MTLSTDSKLARIRAVLNLAENAATTGEAETAMAKALQMMASYGVDQAMLNSTPNHPTDTLTSRRITALGPYQDAKGAALGWIAAGLGLRTVCHWEKRGTKRQSTGFTILGYTSDLDRFDLLWTSALMQITTGIMRLDTWGMVAGEQRIYRRNFILGFGAKVKERLIAGTHAARTASEQRTGVSTDIVFVGREERVCTYEQQLFPDLGKGRRTVALGGRGEGYRDGQRAGGRVDLGGARVANSGRPAIGN